MSVIPTSVISGIFWNPDCWDVIDNYDTLSISGDTVTSPIPMIVTEINIGGTGYIVITSGYSSVSTSSTISYDYSDTTYLSELVIT